MPRAEAWHNITAKHWACHCKKIHLHQDTLQILTTFFVLVVLEVSHPNRSFKHVMSYDPYSILYKNKIILSNPPLKVLEKISLLSKAKRSFSQLFGKSTGTEYVSI